LAQSLFQWVRQFEPGVFLFLFLVFSAYRRSGVLFGLRWAVLLFFFFFGWFWLLVCVFRFFPMPLVCCFLDFFFSPALGRPPFLYFGSLLLFA